MIFGSPKDIDSCIRFQRYVVSIIFRPEVWRRPDQKKGVFSEREKKRDGYGFFMVHLWSKEYWRDLTVHLNVCKDENDFSRRTTLGTKCVPRTMIVTQIPSRPGTENKDTPVCDPRGPHKESGGRETKGFWFPGLREEVRLSKFMVVTRAGEVVSSVCYTDKINFNFNLNF